MHGRGPDVGYSAMLTILGCLAATVVGALQMRAPRPAGGPLGAAPGYGPGYPSAPGYPPAAGYPPAQAAAPSAAPCPRCQAPTYVAQYQRAYCGRCQQYV